MKLKIGGNSDEVGFFEIGKNIKKVSKMESKTKLSGETVFVFSEDEANTKAIFEGSLMVGNTSLEDLIEAAIKAAVLAHAELQKQESLAWSTVEDLIKEIALIEEGVEFEYNSISGEFSIIKK